MIPNPTPQQGCIVPNPCDPNPCGRDAMCIPQVNPNLNFPASL